MRKSAACIALIACTHGQAPAPTPTPATSIAHAPATSTAHAPAPAPTPTPAPALAPDPIADATVALAIPDLPQDPSSPPSGWCGETAIQQSLLPFGIYAPQPLIHAAGKPKHPDLYSDELPIALAALGAKITFYPSKTPGFLAYSRWVQAAIDDGDPVVAGVKILPTDHPEWGLDHFVLAIGYGEKGLLVNTTWEKRAWVADTTTPGLSFKNAFYAIRVRGVEVPKGSTAAVLRIVEQGASALRLEVTCLGAETSATLRLERRRKLSEAKPQWSIDLPAKKGEVRALVEAPVSELARFSCKPT